MIADAVEKHLRAQFESELARARSRAELCLRAYHEHKLQLIDVQNKLKSTEDKLKDAEALMLDDAKNAQQAIDAIFAEAQDREKEMARRHQAWVSEQQAKAQPTFGDQDQALQEARAEADEAKSDLLTAEQDLANKQGEVDYWKRRAEEAEKNPSRRSKPEKPRGRSLGRPDEENEDAFSFSHRASNGLGSSRKNFFTTRSPSPRRARTPSPPKYSRPLFRPTRRSSSSSSSRLGNPLGLGASGSSSSDSDEDSSCSTDGTNRRSRKSKARGQVKAIVLEPVPTASGFKAYQLQVYTQVLAASKRSSLHTLRWIQQIETAKLKKLEKPKTEDWDDLERVLAETNMKVVTGVTLKELLNYQ